MIKSTDTSTNDPKWIPGNKPTVSGWYWAGAASLSQLAQTGTSRPNDCKFPAPVDEVILTESIEILAVTDEAKASIEGVKEWKQ